MPAITPSSTTWTLRLKHNKTTVLLHVDPLQTLASVRAELLHCLRETFPDNNNNNNNNNNNAGRPLPADPAELQLAKMRDPSDPERGWVLLVSGGGGGGGSDEKGKGRAKAKAKAASSGGADSLKAVGVKDNSVLAFRWGVRAGRDGGGDGDAGGEMEVDEDDEDDEDGEGDVGNDDDDDAWDVVLPKYEDSYMDALEDEGIVE